MCQAFLPSRSTTPSTFESKHFLRRLAAGTLVLNLIILVMGALSLRKSLRNHQRDALATAQNLHVNVVPFIIVVMMAASAGFATPIGYQTNLMVYGPGGYRFSDYLRIGVPLDLLIRE